MTSLFTPSKTRAAGAAILAAGLALAACSPKPPVVIPPAPTPTPTATATAASNMDGNSNNLPVIAPGSQADFLAQLNGQDRVYFAFDKFNIDPVAAASLRAQAAWLLKYPAKRATIEGHADERGTVDYNLALGERRATAAKNYLVSLGVDASRLNVVTYGKSRPAETGSDEAAYAKNRRAVTVTID